MNERLLIIGDLFLASRKAAIIYSGIIYSLYIDIETTFCIHFNAPHYHTSTLRNLSPFNFARDERYAYFLV